MIVARSFSACSALFINENVHICDVRFCLRKINMKIKSTKFISFCEVFN